MKTHLWLLGGLCLSMACGRPPPPRGSIVTDGVARLTREVRANETDLVPMTVLFPSDPDGLPRPGSLPAVIWIQGGAVNPERYEWQAVELAKRGAVVVLPRHPNDLAFFAIDTGLVARRLLLEPGDPVLGGVTDPKRVAVMGHSLGGVVAMKLALSGGFAAVIVQASFQDGADDAKLPSLGIPSLYLAGRGDCQAREAQVRAGWAKVPAPSALVLLEGVTHFQFTNSDADDVQRKCVPTASLDDAHARIMDASWSFLDAAFSGQQVGEPRLRAIPQSIVEVK